MAKGRYRIIRKIADGGMAEIFLGTQHGVEGFERPVVLKRILPALLVEPQFKNLMIDEAHVAMSLSHSNIVQVLDLGQAKGSYYLVLELIDGWDLNNILNRLKSVPDFELPATLALFVAAEVCRALAYAHARRRDGKAMGIVHRDVSPHNVLISVEGEVKLTDFGIAKALVKRENTVQGVIKGKLAFMSPEQASGAAIDARSDLFSLGTLLYLMFTGKRPFEAPTDLESIFRVQRADFPAPEIANPALAHEVAELISRAMQLRPSERYQSADAMLEAIEDVQRQVFGPSGKTELKRWLSELEKRDQFPSISRMPGGMGGNADETMELGQEDIQLEMSSSGPLPQGLGNSATVAAQSAAHNLPAAITAAPVDAKLSQPTVADRRLSPKRKTKSRRNIFVLAAAAVVLAAGAIALRGSQKPAAVTPPAARTAVVAQPSEPVAPPLAKTDAAAANNETAPSPASSAAAEAQANSAAEKADDDEEALLAHTEPDVQSVVIGDDPADEDPAAHQPTTASASKATSPRKPTAQSPVAAAPVVASVKIISKPPGAVIKIKKRVFGRAPMNLRFRAGQSYELVFVKQGYAVASKRLAVSTRKNQTLTITLRKKAKTRKNFIQRVFGL